jgi:hypothetical protein
VRITATVVDRIGCGVLAELHATAGARSGDEPERVLPWRLVFGRWIWRCTTLVAAAAAAAHQPR